MSDMKMIQARLTVANDQCKEAITGNWEWTGPGIIAEANRRALQFAVDEIERLNLALAQGKYGEGVVCGYCSHPGSLMLAKLEGLQAVIDTFDKTADGVTPTIGMELYYREPYGNIRWFKVYSICQHCVQVHNVWKTHYVTANCYSTKAAAQAAEEKP